MFDLQATLIQYIIVTTYSRSLQLYGFETYSYVMFYSKCIQSSQHISILCWINLTFIQCMHVCMNFKLALIQHIHIRPLLQIRSYTYKLDFFNIIQLQLYICSMADLVGIIKFINCCLFSTVQIKLTMRMIMM